MRYSFSFYEALALTQILGTKPESNSPLNDAIKQMQLNHSIEQNVETTKAKILAEGCVSRALEQIFGVIENPERLYTVFVKSKSDFNVLNFYEKNQKIVPFSSDGEIFHVDSVFSRKDLTDFVLTQLGETTENGPKLRMTLDFIEFLVFSSASALSRTFSDDQITNLLGEASFTKEAILEKVSTSGKLVFNITAELKAVLANKQWIIKTVDLLNQKGLLKCSKSGSNERFTIDEKFTEITNVLSSPDLVVVVCNSDFRGNLSSFSFVKSWDNELVSIDGRGNQVADSSVIVERHFKSDLKAYVHNSLFTPEKQQKTVTGVNQQTNLQKGCQLINSGKFNDAIKYFHETLQLTPDNSDVWYWLGVSYHRLNLLFDAIRCYQKAVDNNSSNGKAWFDMGTAHYQMKDYVEAANCFSKITQIYPEPSDSWFWAGLSYGNNGEFEQAINYLSEASKRNPEDPQIWYRLGQATIETLNKSQNRAEAKNIATNALQNFKNAEEKGIKKVLSEDNQKQVTIQMKQLVEFLQQ